MNTAWRTLVLLCCAAFGIALAFLLLQLPPPEVRLAEQVMAKLDASGAAHPVTAVLLNFRAYDTLLEIAVLLLALIGVLVATDDEHTPSHRISGKPQAVLQSMTRLIVPLMILVAGYLLWAGAHRAGGAFQAGAVLASAIVLLYLAGLAPAWAAPPLFLRIALAAGFLIFLGSAAALMSQGTLLQYPPSWAKTLILTIEAGLTLSLGLILAGLFLWLPSEEEEQEE